jgi:hypothetical protein
MGRYDRSFWRANRRSCEPRFRLFGTRQRTRNTNRSSARLIHDQCLNLITPQAPVARDARFVTRVLGAIVDLESASPVRSSKRNRQGIKPTNFWVPLTLFPNPPRPRPRSRQMVALVALTSARLAAFGPVCQPLVIHQYVYITRRTARNVWATRVVRRNSRQPTLRVHPTNSFVIIAAFILALHFRHGKGPHRRTSRRQEIPGSTIHGAYRTIRPRR